MTDFERLLTVLTQAEVEFIVIGGFAATAHGSAHITVDLDVVYGAAPLRTSTISRARSSPSNRTCEARPPDFRSDSMATPFARA